MKVNPKANSKFSFERGRRLGRVGKEAEEAGSASRKDNIDTRSPAIAFSLNGAPGEHESERTGLKFLRRRHDDGIPTESTITRA